MTTKDKFRSSIRRGTGEAVLIMQQHPRIDFSKEILQACIRVYAYDPQCEGSRGFYLSQLIDHSPQKEKIIKKILDALSNKKEDDWQLQQLFNIARIYAQRGNNSARLIMYKLFKRNLGSETELIDLDGLQALTFIAHVKGKAIALKKSEWEDDSLLKYAQENIPKSNPMALLKVAAKKDPFIKIYIDAVKENIKLRKEYKKTQYDYRSVKSLIDSKKNFGPYVGKRLKKSELSKLAADFVAESDSDKIRLFLRVFDKVKFPLHYQHLLKFAAVRNAKIRERAITALAFFSNAEVRRFALSKIKTSKHPQDYLPLLTLNFRPTDSKLIWRTIKHINNKDLFHWVGIRILNIYEENRTKSCVLPLMEIYNRGYCNICRESAVKRLQENGVLPRKLKKEIRFDSFVEPGSSG